MLPLSGISSGSSLFVKVCVCLFDLILYVSVNNLSVTSGRVFMGCTSTKLGLMCLAQGHNAMMPVRLEPTALWSQVKHSTTEPLCSPKVPVYQTVSRMKRVKRAVFCRKGSQFQTSIVTAVLSFNGIIHITRNTSLMSRYFLPGSSVLSFMSLSTIFQYKCTGQHHFPKI